LLSSNSSIRSTFDNLLDKCTTVSFAVAWASSGFDSCAKLFKAKEKIRNSVVGTHFYQTDPAFIREFVQSQSVKFVLNPTGVFHPKLYLFEGRAGKADCLIGSANFTAGAFGRNAEVLLHFSGFDFESNRIIDEVRNNIISYWKSDAAICANEVDLDRYVYWKSRVQHSIEKSQGMSKGKPISKYPADIDLLNWSWDEFLKRVKDDAHHALDRRIAVLDAAQELFRTKKSLADMNEEDRKGIGGFKDTEEIPWGWFGSMKGAGVFKNLVNQNPATLSHALDQIPIIGPVQREKYAAFVDLYKSAFPLNNDGKPYRHGLATASRLLAMKRPDYFVCLDSANRIGISEAFGIKLENHDYDLYWDGITEMLCEAKWWNAECPNDKIDRKVWEGRAAFLDSIFYLPE